MLVAPKRGRNTNRRIRNPLKIKEKLRTLSRAELVGEGGFEIKKRVFSSNFSLIRAKNDRKSALFVPVSPTRLLRSKLGRVYKNGQTENRQGLYLCEPYPNSPGVTLDIITVYRYNALSESW